MIKPLGHRENNHAQGFERVGLLKIGFAQAKIWRFEFGKGMTSETFRMVHANELTLLPLRWVSNNLKTRLPSQFIHMFRI